MPAQKYIATRITGNDSDVPRSGSLATSSERHQRDEQRREPVTDARQVELAIVEAPRQHEHRGDLGQLRRLEADRPDVEPALGTHRAGADHQHGHQQQHRDSVERIGERFVHAVMDGRCQAATLPPSRARAAGAIHSPSCCPGTVVALYTIEQPDGDERERGEHHRHIDLGPSPPSRHGSPPDVSIGNGTAGSSTRVLSATNRLRRTAPAIGAAMLPPWPLFSTTNAMAMRGSSAGA